MNFQREFKEVVDDVYVIKEDFHIYGVVAGHEWQAPVWCK